MESTNSKESIMAALKLIGKNRMTVDLLVEAITTMKVKMSKEQFLLICEALADMHL